MTDGSVGLEGAWYRGATWLWLLRPLEFLFRGLAVARRQAYAWGWLRQWRAPCPVVVVGNITVGGTGKTPIVIALVEHLQSQGVHVGVVSRGYGGQAPNYPFVVDGDSDAAHCGDEPLLIHNRTGCPVVVAPSRAEAAQCLVERFKPQLIISDDGLQHYALARNFEIAVIDAYRGLGNGFCLPAGPLREPPSRLHSVDYTLLRGSEDPAQGVRYTVDGLINLETGEARALEPDAVPAPVQAMAGIGQPQQFFATLTAAGLVFDARVFEDHHAFVPGDFAAHDAQSLIMTEKDAVKCRSFARPSWWYVRISARLPDNLLQAVVALVGAH